MLKRFFWSFLCITFPSAVLFTHDNPGGALIAMLMQATLIGWIPAIIWAFRVYHDASALNKKSKHKKD